MFSSKVADYWNCQVGSIVLCRGGSYTRFICPILIKSYYSSLFLFNNSLGMTEIVLQRINFKGPKAKSEWVPGLPPKNLSKLYIQKKSINFQWICTQQGTENTDHVDSTSTFYRARKAGSVQKHSYFIQHLWQIYQYFWTCH